MNRVRSAWRLTSSGYQQASSRYQSLSRSRVGKTAAFFWRRKKTTLFVAGSLYFYIEYKKAQAYARQRDTFDSGTVLLWKMSIVEQRSSASTLNLLLQSRDDGDEPARILTLWEVLRTLKMAAADERIVGLVADFSHDSLPAVPSYHLGLAQIEELMAAISELKDEKEKQLGKGKFKTAAFADTFSSQGTYALATAFDNVYIQPSGEIPLTGISATLPFFAKLLKWIGIEVHAEARNAYKSVVAPYTSEELSPAQRENEEELLADLHDHLCLQIACRRFGREPEDVDKVKELAYKGPFSASEAVEAGLIDGIKYRQHVLRELFHEESVTDESAEVQQGESGQAAQQEEDEEEETIPDSYPVRGFYHYAQVMGKAFEQSGKTLDIGVVYLLNEIDLVTGSEFGTSSVLRGLREAGADDKIGAVILRIDSGGGGVVPSDTIHNAVRELQEKGKIVIASFSNAAASGAYLISTHADAILADMATITGSIGVAALRPTVTNRFLDRLMLTTESFFNGSKYESLLHPLEGEDLARFKRHVDEHYADFKQRVCSGRAISEDVIDLIAGGRVFTGGKAMSLSPIAAVYEQSLLPALPLPQVLTDMFERSFGRSTKLVNPAALGKGIIDGIGGLAQASTIAAEMQLTRAVQMAQAENPGWSPSDALDEVLPDLPHTVKEDGTIDLEIAVNLKRFPAEKSFLTTLVEQSRRGDGIDPNTVSMSIRALIVGVLASFLSREIDALGLRQAIAPLFPSVSRRAEGMRLEEPLVHRIRL